MELTPAFAAGSAVFSKTITQTTSSVVSYRRTQNPTRFVIRRLPVLPSKNYNALSSICGCVGACAHKASPAAATVKMTIAVGVGEQVIADLMAENAAFVRGEAKIYPGVPEERARLSSEGQTPKVAVIACADSRVAPEIIFRTNVGELFVCRAAGNTAWGNEVLGSLEYAINVLKVSAVLVLGHTKCGAVAAAVGGGELPGALGEHITNISKGLVAKGGLVNDVDLAVEANVKGQLDFLRKDPSGAVAQGEKKGLAVRGGVYDITTGAVRLV